MGLGKPSPSTLTLRWESMYYDCSLFFNELDLLEIRLNELKDLDCKHVIVESSTTHQGNPKPYNLEDNWDRFKEFHSKMIYIKLNQINNPMASAWVRENFHRNYISIGLKDAKLDDIVYIGDIDEIPRKSIFKTFKPEFGCSSVGQTMSYYYVNCMIKEPWTRAQIMTYENLRSTSPNTSRYEHIPSLIDNGGWHFSYLGGVDKIIEKIEAFSHTEFNNAEFKSRDRIEKCIKDGVDFIGRKGLEFYIEPLNESYPKHILNNQDKYKHLIAEIK